MSNKKIGIFRGREISEMDREELLAFAAWAALRIEGLEAIESSTMESRLDLETRRALTARVV